MKKLYHQILKPIFLLAILFISTFTYLPSKAQILNSNDPVTIYDSNNPPALPGTNQLAKWVITPTIQGWNTSQYKPYFYNFPFRLLYPTSYKQGVNDGKLYPLILFFHGLGEAGLRTNNDYQLYHGGLPTLTAENSGVIDAYCLFPQNQSGVWVPSDAQSMIDVVNYMILNNKVDPQRIIVYGLSKGGQETWDLLDNTPTFAAASIMFSAANYAYQFGIPGYRFTPIWLSQGGHDTDPAPTTAQTLVNLINTAGGNITYSYFPNDGHNTWDDMWANANFFPWMMQQNKANPWPLHGQTTFCSTSGISDTLGLTPGFTSYQWKMNGNVIPGATNNTYVAKQTGTYSARYLNGTTWSSWSPTPVVVTINVATQTPAIQLAKLESNLLPSLDSSQGVYLTVPGSFTSYSWVKSGTSTVLGTGQVFLATAPGNYQCTVSQKFSCSSIPSPIYTVSSANGTGAPSPIGSLTITTVSTTSLKLNWTYTNSTTYPATGFEIYRATNSSGPYTFLALVPVGTTNYLEQNLSSSLTYYYKMRAVTSTSASTSIGPIPGITIKDLIPPSVPNGLVLYPGTSTTNLVWNPSTDNIAVAGYYVLVNGVKNYTTTNPSLSIYNLSEGKSFTFSVVAFDQAGNISAPSTSVSAPIYDNGFNYKFFTTSGTWTALKDLNAITPSSFGNSPNLDLSKATQSNNYAFLWNGTLHIPVTGNYTFNLASSDGSALFIDVPYDFTLTPTLSNDGVHTSQTAQVTRYLTKGEHRIAISYFRNTNPPSLSLSWQNTANGVGSTPQVVPNFIFAIQNPDNTTTPPTAPNTLTVTDNMSGETLNWKDAGTNNVGFNIYRAPSGSANYNLVNNQPVSGSVLRYTDSSALGNFSYQYKVNAINPFGVSSFTNIVTIITGIKNPLINPIVSPVYQVGSQDTLLFSVTPRSGSNLTLSVTGLTASAKFTDLGSGNGMIVISPVSGDIGSHTMVLKAVDSYGNSSSANFSITVKAAVTLGIPSPPTLLNAQGRSVNSTLLNWVIAPKTTTYYIYQTTSSTGPWTLIDSVAGTVNTYQNNGLNPNTTYYYQLKSKNASGLSNPGNIAYATTLDFVTELQFNSDYPAGFPWNHVNSSPYAGLTISNLATTAGNNSGINVTMTNGFDGINTLGAVTGNNSGIYPDYVIRGQFYVQTPDTAILTVSGLSANMGYDFVFFNSFANPFGPSITSYIINGKTVNLDPTNNSTNTVQINNVLADAFGNVKIVIKAGQGQTYGIINALVIQAHQLPATSSTCGALAANWTQQDIGLVAIAGQTCYNNNAWSVQASGNDIWDNADAFHFTDKMFSGDGQVTARVDALDNANIWNKAGVMFRENNAAGARNAFMAYTSGNGMTFQYRSATNSSSTNTAVQGFTLPYYVRIIKRGSTFAGYVSQDSVSWKQIGSKVDLGFGVGTTCLAGLASTSHDNTQLSSAQFSKVPLVFSSDTTNGAKPITCQVPTNLSVTNISQNSATLNWSAIPGATSYTVQYKTVGASSYTSITVTTNSLNLTSLICGTNYTFNVQTPCSTGGVGAASPDNAFTMAVCSSTCGALPANWIQQDIGSVGIPGQTCYNNNAWSVKASGNDIWDNADAFHYSYKTFSGDGQVAVRVDALDNANVWDKAGVMFRENSSVGSRNAFMAYTSGNGMTFQYRSSTNGSSAYTAVTGFSLPYYVKVVKKGSTFSGYVSQDSITWKQVGSTVDLGFGVGSTCLAGLASTSHDNSQLSSAQFSKVPLVFGSDTTTTPKPIICPVSSGLSASNISQTAATLNWTSIAGTTSYTVQYKVVGAANYTLATTSTNSLSLSSLVCGTNYTFHVQALCSTGSLGTASGDNAFATTVCSSNCGPLPSNWIQQDIGSVGIPGQTCYNNNAWSVKASGNDIWDYADAFHYSYKTFSGDGQVAVRVDALDNANVWDKAGVMFRENSSVGSRNAFMAYTSGNGMTFQYRSSTNGSSAYTAVTGFSLPYYVKVVKHGSTFSGYVSQDSVTWQQVGGTVDLGFGAGSNCLAGIASTSHDNTKLSISQFDKVSIINFITNATNPASALTIFPVPFTNVLNIQLNSGLIQQVDLLDLNGKIYTRVINVNSNIVTLNTSSIVSGLYVLSVTTSNGVIKSQINKL